MNISRPLISICIPTYNRCEKVNDLVKSILEYEGQEIQVVVLDNCSTDDTELLLSKVEDERYAYIRNKHNIGSIPNILKSLTYGSGEFVFLCLDKDRIIVENIHHFIKAIKNDTEFVFGQCTLNIDVFKKEVVFEKGLSSLLNLVYTSEHPSGLFIKNDILINAGIIDDIINGNNKTFAFNTEILKAELSVLGNSKRINIPLVDTEMLEVCEKELSHTYRGDNIYFFPNKIIETYNIYIQNLYNLKISKKHKRIVSKYIFISLLGASTFGFRKIMENRNICSHHGIQTRNVTIRELIAILKNFNFNFIGIKNIESVFWRIKSLIIFNLSFFAKIVFLKLKNSV